MSGRVVVDVFGRSFRELPFQEGRFEKRADLFGVGPGTEDDSPQKRLRRIAFPFFILNRVKDSKYFIVDVER